VDFMEKLITSKKKTVNVLLGMAGISLVIFYSICGDSCSYLQGDLFGINLKYLGIAYMGLFVALTLSRQARLAMFLLSAGAGAELYLIGFQIYEGVFCPFCFLFGLIVIVLFTLNLELSKKKAVALFVGLGFLLFLIFFEGSIIPVYADEALMPSFGKGKITVRLYSDYFCAPCTLLEPQVTPLLTELVQKNIIQVTFVDTPMHRPTTLYARYFLFILNHKKEFKRILAARHLLFTAAKNGIIEQAKLEGFLKKNNIRFKPYNTEKSFKTMNAYCREDKVLSTPTCTIIKGDRKDAFKGPDDIMKALEALKTE
jgi:hypothetical protein